jgi:integrase
MGVIIRERPKNSGEYWVFINHKGKRKAKKIGDKKSAEVVARKVRQQLAGGDLGLLKDEKPAPLFKDYALRWHAIYVMATCKENTQILYAMLLRNHLVPAFGARRLDEVNLADFKELILKKIRDGLSVSTILNMKACMSGIYTHAIEDEIVSVNPADRTGRLIKKFKVKDRKEDLNPLTREEVALLLEAVKKQYPPYYPLFLCCLRTGMRIGEVLALQWGDLDFNSRFIEIRRAVARGKITTPKNGKIRRVDMSLHLTDTLEELRTERKRQALRKGWQEVPEWVFVTEYGTRYDVNNLRKIFNKCLEKAGLRRIRIHDMRHTYASLLIAQGESLAYVRDQLGHHSIQITVDTYGHLVPVPTGQQWINWTIRTQQSATYLQPEPRRNKKSTQKLT